MKEDIIFDKPLDCIIKKGWEDAGKVGECYGIVEIYLKQEWAIIVWEGNDDPDMIKAEALAVRSSTWVNLLTEVATKNIEL